MKEEPTCCGVSEEEFERFTRYCNASDNAADNERRAQG